MYDPSSVTKFIKEQKRRLVEIEQVFQRFHPKSEAGVHSGKPDTMGGKRVGGLDWQALNKHVYTSDSFSLLVMW